MALELMEEFSVAPWDLRACIIARLVWTKANWLIEICLTFLTIVITLVTSHGDLNIFSSILVISLLHGTDSKVFNSGVIRWLPRADLRFGSKFVSETIRHGSGSIVHFPIIGHVGRDRLLGQQVIVLRVSLFSLPVLALLSGKSPHTVLVNLLDVVINSLFNADLDLVLLARVNVAVDVDEGRLPWRSCEEPKVAELIRGMGLILRLVHDSRRQKRFDRRFFDIYVLCVDIETHSGHFCLLKLVGFLHGVRVFLFWRIRVNRRLSGLHDKHVILAVLLSDCVFFLLIELDFLRLCGRRELPLTITFLLVSRTIEAPSEVFRLIILYISIFSTSECSHIQSVFIFGSSARGDYAAGNFLGEIVLVTP